MTIEKAISDNQELLKLREKQLEETVQIISEIACLKDQIAEIIKKNNYDKQI